MDQIKEEEGGALTPGSVAYLRETPLEKRKSLGQYPTPRTIYTLAVEQLELREGDQVVDPAVGTGELLLAVREKQKNLLLTGFDIDSAILAVSQEQFLGASDVNLYCLDTLSEDRYDGRFDAAIVNPPYFEFTPSPEIRRRYREVISGRVNIYALFVKKTLDLLRPGGKAVFIVPPSMNNGAYFKALRSYIIKTARIDFLDIVEHAFHFEEAQVSVQIIAVTKLDKGAVGTDSKYVLDLGKISGGPSNIIFTVNPQTIEARWRGRSSIAALGYDVATGTVVWNQHKQTLSDTPRQGVLPVYYAKDISSGVLSLADSLRERRYLPIGEAVELNTPAILVNRIVGAVGKGKIRAAIVRDRYYSENHVNVIFADSTKKQQISLERLQTIMCNDPEIISYIQEFSANTQLSAKELKYFLPINIKYA